MEPTKVFLRKMTLGHKIRKFNHSLRIRCQKWFWRPMEHFWCLLGAGQCWWMMAKIAQNRNILIFQPLDFDENRVFWQTKKFETWTFVEKRKSKIFWSWGLCGLRRWLLKLAKAYFWAFFQTQYFWYFRVHEKINYWSKWPGGNARKSFAIRSFDPAPRYSPNPCRKSHILGQKPRFWPSGAKFTNMDPHQPNRIASTKFNFVDVAGINRIILIIGHEAIRPTGSNLGRTLYPKNCNNSTKKTRC